MSGQSDYTPIYAGARVVGAVCGDTFRKAVRGSKHFLRRPAAIALDASSLDAAEQHGARWVAVTDKETGVIYRAAISHIRQAGFEFDRGFGRQIGLLLDGWVKSGRGLSAQMKIFDE